MLPETAKAQFLSEVSNASENCRIVAANDILDQHGAKLWANNQPVSRSLQQRLLDRKLKLPLEACLRAEDGITTVHLYEQLMLLIASDHMLAPVLRQHSVQLTANVRSLPLHAVAQLLLTIAHSNRPSAFAHAIEGMALAGAMALHAGYDRGKTRLAMLGGLLHDIGEIYIDPSYFDTDKSFDTEIFRHLATHPLLGADLIKSLMDYPPTLWQGIAQHHERLCGTGFPGMRSEKDVGELGRILAVVDTTLSITSMAEMTLQHASVALRVVPGEYDTCWIGFISKTAAITSSSQLITVDDSELDLARATAQITIEKIRAAHSLCDALADDPLNTITVRSISKRAAQLLFRLELAYRSSGISLALPASSPEEIIEQLSVTRELTSRLKKIRSECLWSSPERTHLDDEKLVHIWEAMA